MTAAVGPPTPIASPKKQNVVEYAAGVGGVDVEDGEEVAKGGYMDGDGDGDGVATVGTIGEGQEQTQPNNARYPRTRRGAAECDRSQSHTFMNHDGLIVSHPIA